MTLKVVNLCLWCRKSHFGTWVNDAVFWHTATIQLTIWVDNFETCQSNPHLSVKPYISLRCCFRMSNSTQPCAVRYSAWSGLTSSGNLAVIIPNIIIISQVITQKPWESCCNYLKYHSYITSYHILTLLHLSQIS